MLNSVVLNIDYKYEEEEEEKSFGWISLLSFIEIYFLINKKNI